MRTILILLAVYAFTAFGQMTVHDVQIPAPEEMGPDVLISDPGVSFTPPPNPQVGDSWVWWLWTWYPMPPHFEQHVCTVRGMSDRGYVVVKDTEWLVTIDQADVDSILEHWDNSSIGPYPDQGIYEIDSLSFGTPPDELDNDPRIYLMWYNFEVAADGFFFVFDQYPEGTWPQYHSNECEVLYLNSASPGGPSGNYMHGVIAHEFEHMIHWKQDEDEASWVDEGMAELAMWFFGNPDNISSFNSNPDNNLTQWDGDWADYIQTYLWSLYFYERYGGHDAVYALVENQANSMAGYDAVLDDFGYTENTEDMFSDWAVANFLDDTSIGDGRYGYIGDDLPAFNTSGSYSSYPVDVTAVVNHWAADYLRFQNITTGSLEITFDGSDDNSFRVNALVLYETAPTLVVEMPLDGADQTGSVYLYGLTEQDQVIMVVASVSSSGAQQYQFTAQEMQGIESGQQGEALLLSVSASPFTQGTAFSLEHPSDQAQPQLFIKIFDILGREITRLVPDEVSPGYSSVFWNCEDVKPGVYFAVAVSGSDQSTARVVLLP